MRAVLHSLRWRIVLIAAALVAAASLVIGGVTLLALQGYLVGQLDQRLVSSAQRVDRIGGQLDRQQPGSGLGTDASADGSGSTGAGAGAGADGSGTGGTGSTGSTGTDSTGAGTGDTGAGTDSTGTGAGADGTGRITNRPHFGPASGDFVGDFVGVPGQAPQTIVAVIDGGEIVANGFVDANGTRHELDTREKKVLAGLHGRTSPSTVDLGGELGRYRVASSALPGGATIVTGVPLAPVDSAVWRVGGVILGVAILATAAGAAAAAVVIGRSLRPLGRVAGVAAAVTGVRLDRGDVRLSTRVAARDLASTEEVGQVGGALNALLAHVADALAVRQASEETMRRFVADASHELRTPLATVRAYAQLSAREHPELPADLERNIGRIDRESVRMGELVDQLLLLARLDAHAHGDAGANPGADAGAAGAGAGAGVAAGAGSIEQASPEHTEVNLSLVVAEAATDARLAASDHEWHLDLDAEPVLIDGDESQLRRLVANLLANAAAHTPAGTRVTVGLHAVRDIYTLTVTDDGPGVPPELQPTVFDRFARGDAARNRDAGSTGLGLAIVRAIAEAHGGTVELESAPGRTVFTVTLPAAG